VEQVIADLKDQALAHFPSGQFAANGAWAVLACLAHNLLRWTQLLGLPETTVRAARMLRRRLVELPGRLTRHARGWTLHLPARWPWRTAFTEAVRQDQGAAGDGLSHSPAFIERAGSLGHRGVPGIGGEAAPGAARVRLSASSGLRPAIFVPIVVFEGNSLPVRVSRWIRA
jgi:hypothetical protein